jgi:hypothetical protein
MAIAETLLGKDDIRRLCGDILDWKIVTIEQICATPEEIEEAAARASDEDDVMAEEGKRFLRRANEIHEILTADEEPDDRA